MNLKKIAIITLILVLCDQILKILVTNLIPFNDSVPFINNLLYITNIKNYGAAFGIMQNTRFLLIGFAVLALVLIYFTFIKGKKLNKLEIISYSLLISGIIGNLIDRIIRGYVVDYVEFHLFNYPFPIFNLADACIVIGAIIFAINIIRGDKNELNCQSK